MMSQFANGCCSKCGGKLEGDGVSKVLVCEFAIGKEEGREADSGVVECDFED